MFEFLLNTGDISITGCQQAADTTTFSTIINNSNFVTWPNIQTGNSNLAVILNSQSLSEGDVVNLGNSMIPIYQSSGDYFFLNSGSTARLDQFFEAFNGREILFRERDKTKYAIAVYDNTGELTQKAIEAVSLAGLNSGNLFSNLDCFLNGQKIYSGQSLFNNGGQLQILADFTGRFFATEKLDTLISNTGEIQFLQGIGFLEGENVCFSFGMEQKNINYLELYSGVSIINKQKNACLTKKPNEQTTDFSL